MTAAKQGAANGVAGTGQGAWSQVPRGKGTSRAHPAEEGPQGPQLGLSLHSLHPTQHTLVFAEVPPRRGRGRLRLPAAGSDVRAGADRPAGMFSPREALAGGCAFLGIVSGREGGYCSSRKCAAR